ncbi:MAG: pheS [Candidatus Saccharibacteria bacterium]|nr:pheS [Candidatus Saccharibacteria bacterium]
MQIIFTTAGDSDFIALYLGFYFGVLFTQQLRDLFGLVLVETFLERYFLGGFEVARGDFLAGVEQFLALTTGRQLFSDNVEDGFNLPVTVAGNDQTGLVGTEPVNRGRRAFEVIPAGKFALRLVKNVIKFSFVVVRDDIERKCRHISSILKTMKYTFDEIKVAADRLQKELDGLENKADILKSVELRALYEQIKLLPPEKRRDFGQQVNALKEDIAKQVAAADSQAAALPPLDVTAPFDTNTPPADRPHALPVNDGSVHPLMTELTTVLDIFYRMGFTAVESREIDDDYHMFGALNFPEGHPARDDYDTFMTKQTDANGKPLIAPAHTSTMQNRVLQAHRDNLEKGDPIAVVIPGRVFRNEDLDARHEHTFYQLEGVYVDKGVHAGHLIATLKTFLQTYYGKTIEVKTQPFYFPFTEPSFEFALSCPFCNKQGCNICGQSGWIELLGCGMIHPNVLREAGIDPEIYTGFAWGGGIERLVMMKHDIEDIRHFESGKLDFLRQFS